MKNDIFEYKIIREAVEIDESYLNLLGSQGWELVSIADEVSYPNPNDVLYSETFLMLIFKRKILNPSNEKAVKVAGWEDMRLALLEEKEKISKLKKKNPKK